jgi:hypothetical protein
VYVYLQGDPIKGIVPNHYTTVNPGAHLGVDKVPSSWCEKTAAGPIVGREFHIHFINGRADADPDGIGEYLITHGHALRQRWKAPAGSPVAEADPHWRWRADAEEE